MTENLQNVQVQYFTPPEFAEAVRKAISDESTQAAVAEMLGTTQSVLSSSISQSAQGKRHNFAILARAYETVVDCYDIGRRHDGNIFVIFGDIVIEERESDTSPIVPFATAGGGTVGISKNVVEGLGL